VKKTNYEKEERRQRIKTPITGFPRGAKLTGYFEALPGFISPQSGKRRCSRINYVTFALTHISVKFLFRSQNDFLRETLRPKFLFSLPAGKCTSIPDSKRYKSPSLYLSVRVYYHSNIS
jgi:hypothetical protein